MAREQSFTCLPMSMPVARSQTLVVATSLAISVLASSNTAAQQLEEVTVTASRRAATTQEVPYNISALRGSDIDNSGLVDSGDLLQQVPGVFVADVGGRSNLNSNIVIRGINGNNPGDNNIIPNLTEPPVSTYVGESPLFVNLKMTDVERVEILRGPQGTLYGSGSMGGAIKYIFNRPDPEAFSGRILASASATDDADDLNYRTDLILNIPLGTEERAALRLVAGWEEMAGFVDMPRLTELEGPRGAAVPAGDYLTSGPIIGPVQEDTNESDATYIRASLLWKVSEAVSAQINLFHQEDSFDGESARRITDLESSSGPSNVSESDRRSDLNYETDLANLEVTADLGFATFISSSSWTDAEAENELPSTELYQYLDQELELYFGFPRITVFSDAFDSDKIFTQEFRLVSKGDSNIDWIVGAFYKQQERDGGFYDFLPGYNDWLIASGFPEFTPVDEAYNDFPVEFDREVDFEDMAVFGEFTYRLTDRLQVTAGLRVFKQDFEQEVVYRFPYCSFFCAADGEDLLGSTQVRSEQDFDDHLIKLNASYDISPDHMIYFTFSEGFRHGGANSLPATGPFAVESDLLTYQPDEVDNWEVGIKGYLADKSISYSANLFRADWDNIQLDTFLGLLLMPAVANGESAISQGFETEFNASLTDRLTGSFSYSFTDAEIEDPIEFAGLPVFSGDALPGVSEHSASIAVDFLLPLESGALTLHADASYRSGFETTFNPLHANYADLDGFELMNLAAIYDTDRYSVSLFVNNLTDEEGVTGVLNVRDAAWPQASLAFLRRPRTIGLKASFRF